MSVLDENWEFPIKINTETFDLFNNQLKILHDDYLNKQIMRIQNCEANGQNHLNELQSLIDGNIYLKQEINKKENDYERLKKEYDSYKYDQNRLSLEIKDTHEAFLMAKKFYKKFLKIYYTIEKRNGSKQTIYVQFFTESKKENEKYSVRLLRDPSTEIYDLLETNPKLDVFNELKVKLNKTNDIVDVICSIRNAFASIRNSKKQ